MSLFKLRISKIKLFWDNFCNLPTRLGALLTAVLGVKLPASEYKITLATKFTIFRILAVPVIIYAMVNHWWGIAFGLFMMAALSDTIDGYLARNFGQATVLGACLDPLADKLLILAIYFTLAFVQSPLFTIPLWFVCLVLVKELLQIIGAFILFIRTGTLEIRPTVLGKLTMAVQVLFIVWLFTCYFFHWLPVKTYDFMLGAVLILVLSTLLHYSYRGIKQMLQLLVFILLFLNLTNLNCFELVTKPATLTHNNFAAAATTKPAKTKKSVGSVNNLKAIAFEQMGDILKQLNNFDRLAVSFDLQIIDLRESITKLIENAMKDCNTKDNLLRMRDRDQLVNCVDNLDNLQARLELFTEQFAAELKQLEAEILALKKGVNSDKLNK
ncbi:MAG TPA: CDP-alcohol phosphatidyltransferase family protein [Candidatus Babeliales bacterium]|nr:CDP-alcohol phosphatidyltransferase family protein [Candidatus Babeliales bacterium]